MHTGCVFADGYLYINLQLGVFDSSYSRSKNALKYCCKSLLSCFLDFLKARYMHMLISYFNQISRYYILRNTKTSDSES